MFTPLLAHVQRTVKLQTAFFLQLHSKTFADLNTNFEDNVYFFYIDEEKGQLIEDSIELTVECAIAKKLRSCGTSGSCVDGHEEEGRWEEKSLE